MAEKVPVRLGCCKRGRLPPPSRSQASPLSLPKHPLWFLAKIWMRTLIKGQHWTAASGKSTFSRGGVTGQQNGS